MSNSNSVEQVAQQLNDKFKNQSAQGIIVKTYCETVIKQPLIDFGGITKLQEIQNEINDGLHTAKENANYYMKTIQPEIITNISNLDDYYDLQLEIPAILPTGSTKDEWIETLNVLKTEADEHHAATESTIKKLGDFYEKLGTHSTHFNTYTGRLNSLVYGNGQILESLENDLSDIDSKIGGLISGAVLSGIAVGGGVFLIAVGSIGSFVTAGTSVKIAVLGGGLVLLGVAGAAASTIGLVQLYNQKADLLQKKIQLNAEVRAISGIATSYSNLYKQSGAALTATGEMKTAWELLSNNLSTLSTRIEKGIIKIDQARNLFLKASNTSVKKIREDIGRVKNQMAGIQTETGANNESLVSILEGASQRGYYSKG